MRVFLVKFKTLSTSEEDVFVDDVFWYELSEDKERRMPTPIHFPSTMSFEIASSEFSFAFGVPISLKVYEPEIGNVKGVQHHPERSELF